MSVEEAAAEVEAELADDGVARLPEPPPGAHLGIRVGAGDHVVFYGRQNKGEIAGRPVMRFHDEGWVLDVRTRRWRALPRSPFAATPDLSGIDAVWTGREVLVAGTPCGAIFLDNPDDDDPDPATCAAGEAVGGRLQVAAYSPSRDRWRLVSELAGYLSPEWEAKEREEGPFALAVVPVGEGWTGGEYVLKPAGSPPGLMVLDPADGRWQWTEPLPPGVTPYSLCVAQGRVVGVASPNPAWITPDAGAPSGVPGVTLDPSTLRWEPLSPVDGIAERGTFSLELTCPLDPRAAAVFVESPSPGSGRAPRLLRLDVERRAWEPLPVLGLGRGAAMLVLKGVRVGDVEVLLQYERGAGLGLAGSAGGEGLLVPSRDGLGWQRVPAWPGGLRGIWLGNGRFVVPGEGWSTSGGSDPSAGPSAGLLVDLRIHLARHGVDVADAPRSRTAGGPG